MGNNYCIYVHTNKINGKRYIGQTCQLPAYRWANGEGYKGCTHFYNAVLKYGWDNFEHEILYENLTAEEANALEEKLIFELDTANYDKGYNIRFGGSNSKQSEETKKKISKATKGSKNPMHGKHHTNESKRKLSEMRKGKNNPMYGIHNHPSEETKKKISENHADFRGGKHPRAKSVKCIETNRIYRSIADAERDTNIANQSISKVCKEERNTAGGYHWCYVGGNEVA